MIPKIAFLFLTIGNIYHETPWVNYFKGHEHQYALYVHPKESISPESFFHDAVIPKKERTTWANTMKAQVALLKEALKDPEVTKFVFASESTIPLAEFDEMYSRLTADEASQFYYEKNPHGGRTFGGTKRLYKNPQWVVLNRKHAQFMVDDTILLKKMAKHPHVQEHYPSTLLAHHHELKEVIKKETTLCVWTGDKHPHEFKSLTTDKHSKRLLQRVSQRKFLFGRKFSKKCDLSPLKKYLPDIYS